MTRAAEPTALLEARSCSCRRESEMCQQRCLRIRPHIGPSLPCSACLRPPIT